MASSIRIEVLPVKLVAHHVGVVIVQIHGRIFSLQQLD
jgi:hypothetical protein